MDDSNHQEHNAPSVFTTTTTPNRIFHVHRRLQRRSHAQRVEGSGTVRSHLHTIAINLPSIQGQHDQFAGATEHL